MSSTASAGERLSLFALSLAMLLPSLGTSIANVTLPSLKQSFGVSGQAVQWVVIIYLVVVTASLVAAGRLGDLLGKRRVLLGGIAVFAAASLAAAFASSLWLLLLARALQGAGAAAMMALTLATVGDIVPKSRAGGAVGLLGTISAVGTAMGPSLGGLLVATLGWPSVFAFMALVGAAAFALVFPVLPRDPPAGAPQPAFDVAGTVLLVLGLSAFALAVTITPVTPINAVLAGLAVASTVGFGFVERGARAPLVQLHLLAERGIRAGLISIGVASAIVMTTLVVGPFYLADTLHLGPAATGLIMTIGPGVAALVGLPAGRLVDRVGARAPSLIGLLVTLLGTLAMTWLPATLGVGGYVGSLVLITAGYSLFQAANTTAVMGDIGRQDRGVTAGLLSLARNLGLVGGASIMGSVFALGTAGLPAMGLPPGGEAGLQLAFFAASLLALFALIATLRGQRLPPRHD